MEDCILYTLWLLESTIVTLGLVKAPTFFQGHIKNVLHKHLYHFFIAFLDNIVVYSNQLEENIERVQLVITKLQEACLYLKLSKCYFKMQPINFLSFIVSPKDVEIELDRVRTIAKWPEPASHHDIQVFLGFVNLYRSFISSYSHITKPMSDRLMGGKNSRYLEHFLLTPAMIWSFEESHDAFLKVSVLVHVDPSRPICLQTDTYGFAIAGIILQQQDNAHNSTDGSAHVWVYSGTDHWHLVAFRSQSMSLAKEFYTKGDWERLTIVMSCCHSRHYLLGARHLVKVLTDYHNLQRFMMTKSLTGWQAHW